MNLYLTINQEDTIYTQVINIFETQKGECTNCESYYIFNTRNYFNIMTEENTFRIKFSTKKGRLLKRSVTIIKI